LPGTPENQATLSVNYQRPIMGDKILDVNYGLTSISDVITKVGNRGSGETLGGYTVHNASVAVSTDIWAATLYADNMFDKYAVTGVRTDTDFIDSIGGFTLRRYYHNTLRPRTIGVDFRYSFDW